MSAKAQALSVEESSRCVRDAIGIAHPITTARPRIVSLVPSITELLFDLDLGTEIVGRTGFCIHPKEGVRAVEKVGGTKDVNVEKIKALAPTHAIVNIDENEEPLYQELASFIPHVFVTHPVVPRDNLALYHALGALFGRSSQADGLAQQFSANERRLEDATSGATQRVLYVIWKDPWMIVNHGTYIAQMLQLINWQVQCVDTAVRYPEVRLEDFIGQVDRVLLSSEPYSFRQKHIAEVTEIFQDTAEVSLVDGEMLSWYGSRAIKGLTYLRELASECTRTSNRAHDLKHNNGLQSR